MPRFAICTPNFGTYSDPQIVVRLAQDAESAGWDGFFIWDHLSFVWGPPSADPWILLAAIAASTSRIRIGTAVAVLPRRRPHIMASAAVTLDHLSGGRLILGVGIGGGHDEFSPFGDEPEAASRAAKLDEALLVIDRLWSGERVDHEGAHYRVSGVTLAPLPVQRPRIPIWVGGNAAPSLRRAARWDGWLADSAGPDGMRLAPEDVAARVATIGAARGGLDGFDVAAMGYTGPGSEESEDRIQHFQEAGMTWWLEVLHDMRGDLTQTEARIAAGPPG